MMVKFDVEKVRRLVKAMDVASKGKGVYLLTVEDGEESIKIVTTERLNLSMQSRIQLCRSMLKSVNEILLRMSDCQDGESVTKEI